MTDHNGPDKWSKDAILARYAAYCRELGIATPRDISAAEDEQSGMNWVYTLMEKIIAGIEAGDAACRRIGIEFIEEDQPFDFGKILKSNTARALRRATLEPEEQERVRRRIVGMLIQGIVPHEFKQYARLLKHVGVGELWPEIEAGIDRLNVYVMKFYNYLKMP